MKPLLLLLLLLLPVPAAAATPSATAPGRVAALLAALEGAHRASRALSRGGGRAACAVAGARA